MSRRVIAFRERKPVRPRRTLPVGAPVLPELLTVPEVAERLRSTPQHVYTLLAREQLSSVKVGRKRLVPLTALADFIARNTIEVAS